MRIGAAGGGPRLAISSAGLPRRTAGDDMSDHERNDGDGADDAQRSAEMATRAKGITPRHTAIRNLIESFFLMLCVQGELLVRVFICDEFIAPSPGDKP